MTKAMMFVYSRAMNALERDYSNNEDFMASCADRLKLENNEWFKQSDQQMLEKFIENDRMISEGMQYIRKQTGFETSVQMFNASLWMK